MFADNYVNTVTKLYTTNISTKFEYIPYIRLRVFDHSSFKFPLSFRGSRGALGAELENILEIERHI